jgi:hypothetical protein
MRHFLNLLYISLFLCIFFVAACGHYSEKTKPIGQTGKIIPIQGAFSVKEVFRPLPQLKGEDLEKVVYPVFGDLVIFSGDDKMIIIQSEDGAFTEYEISFVKYSKSDYEMYNLITVKNGEEINKYAYERFDNGYIFENWDDMFSLPVQGSTVVVLEELHVSSSEGVFYNKSDLKNGNTITSQERK